MVKIRLLAGKLSAPADALRSTIKEVSMRWKSLLFLAVWTVIGLVSPEIAKAQEIRVDCSTLPTCQLANNVPWSQINQTWIIRPFAQPTTIYIYLHNRNTVSNRSQTIAAFMTPSQSVTTFSATADQWVTTSVNQNLTANATCNSVNSLTTGACYINTIFASQVAIQFTGGSSSGINNDNFDLSIFQGGANGATQPGLDSSFGAALTRVTSGDNIPNSLGLTFSNNAAGGSDQQLEVRPFTFGLSGWNRPLDASNVIANGDGVSGTGTASSFPVLWNGGTGIDRPRAVNFNNYSVSTSYAAEHGIAITEKGPRWAIQNNPATSSTASASQAAVSGTKHVLDCIAFAADASGAVTAAESSFVVRNGATGVGPIIWVYQDSIQTAAAAGVQTQGPVSLCGLNLVGSTNTAMTCEFTAGATNNHQSISCSGFDAGP